VKLPADEAQKMMCAEARSDHPRGLTPAVAIPFVAPTL
jgi:hypothetical protein